jgi:putative transcriptional regulator
MESYQGHFLVAAPQLLDPNFAKSLVLLIEHDAEGAFGVVVNRPVAKTLQELWREVGSAPCNSRRPVHLGGPVPGPLLALHTNAALAEAEPIAGVFLSAKKQHLDSLVLDDSPQENYKIFIGHAGWGAGQLEEELRQGAWHVTPAAAELIFSADDDLWAEVFRRLGRSIFQSILDVKELPPDPTVN